VPKKTEIEITKWKLDPGYWKVDDDGWVPKNEITAIDVTMEASHIGFFAIVEHERCEAFARQGSRHAAISDGEPTDYQTRAVSFGRPNQSRTSCALTKEASNG
jgi:hypothetical protein